MEALDLEKEFTHDDARLLGQFVDSFNGAASRFQEHYHQLEQKVKDLDLELKQKNRELQANLEEREAVKNHLHNILESVTCGVIVTDLEGRVVTFNRAAEHISRLSSAKVIGNQFDDIFGPSFFGHARLSHQHLGSISKNTEIETKIRPKGEKAIQVNLSISPVEDPEQTRVGTVITLQDLTHLKRLEEQVSRKDRLTAMGEMAVKIAHEVRNPLGSIELFADLLKRELPERDDLQSLAEHISSGVRSINTTISNLLLFIKPHQTPDFKAVDIRVPLDDSVFFSSHILTADDTLRVIKNYAPEPLLVNGDVELLKQVALNLILNGIQAMPNGGTLTIATRKVADPVTRSETVEVSFKDSGTGISKEDLSKVFDPFFTTKERGTGLGLPIVHRILEIHGGGVEIAIGKERGTECVVTLPLVKDNNETKRKRCEQNRY